MTGTHALIEKFEQIGGILTLEGGKAKVHYPDHRKTDIAPLLPRLREHRAEIARILRNRSTGLDRVGIETQGIPSGAVLLAPRYDGRPVPRIPQCLCCAVPYKLDRVQDWQGKNFAWLEPGCECLNRPQALSCCGLCVSHCTCKDRRQ